MAEYFIAQWDYAAEGNYELSFKEGDKIKLLEKHNDDWWEGELNDEIGFFPANRTMAMIEHIKSNFDLQKSAINPYLKPKLPDRPKMDLLVDTTLPDGWSSFYDSTGTIYFSNHSTGESQWERPLPNKDLTFDIKNSSKSLDFVLWLYN